MLDVSSAAEKSLDRVGNLTEALNRLFHPGVIHRRRKVFTTLGIEPYKKVYDTARARIAETMGGKDAPPIDFNGHDAKGSKLFRAFCMADPHLLRIKEEAIAEWSSIFFRSFPTNTHLTDVFRSVLGTDYPSGWVPNIWHSNGINGVLDDMEAPRVFLDLDDTILFHGDIIVGAEEPMVAKVIRPDALQLVQEIKSLGVKVGLYTGATAPSTCRALRADVTYDFYEVREGVPVRVESNSAAKILAEITGCMDFAIPRTSYAQLCPYEAFTSFRRGFLCPTIGGHTTFQHHLVNLKVLPGVGHPASALLDDMATQVRSARDDLARRVRVAKMTYVDSPPVTGVEIVNTHLEVYLSAVAALEPEIRRSNERLMTVVRQLVA